MDSHLSSSSETSFEIIDIKNEALLIAKAIKDKYDPTSASVEVVTSPDISMLGPTNFHGLDAFVKAKPSKKGLFRQFEPIFNNAISKISVACPEVAPQVDEMKSLFQKMMEGTAQHPSKYDEGECFEVLNKVLKEMQSLINRPEFVAVVGPTTARLEELSEEDNRLHVRLEGMLQHADDIDAKEIFTIKDEISKNLRTRLDTLFNRIQMLGDERSKDIGLDQIKNKIKVIANEARDKKFIWHNKMADATFCKRIVIKHETRLSSEERDQLSDIRLKQEVHVKSKMALEEEEVFNQGKLEELLLKMHGTAAKQKKNYIEGKELLLRYRTFDDAFMAAKNANNETKNECKRIEQTCQVRADALENALKFAELSDPALSKGIEARINEFKPKEVETIRAYLKCGAERYEELSERLKNCTIKQGAIRRECDEKKREQFLAIDHEDVEAAISAKKAADSLKRELDTLENSINTISEELGGLRERMSLLHTTLADLGAPEPKTLEAVLQTIKVRILLKEQEHVRRAIAHARAGQANAIAALQERQRMIDHNLAGYLTDADVDVQSGSLIATRGHGSAPLTGIWQGIAAFFQVS